MILFWESFTYQQFIHICCFCHQFSRTEHVWKIYCCLANFLKFH